MASPSNSTVDVMKIVQGRVGRLRVWCQHKAAEAEQIAKASTPWTNRTGDARKLIKGIVLEDNDPSFDIYDHEDKKLVKVGSDTVDGKGAIGIALVHRVEYGKGLERDGDGKYAVLKPTIESMRAEFLEQAGKILRGEL